MQYLYYVIHYKLWCVWHIHLRRFFDQVSPPCRSCTKRMQELEQEFKDENEPVPAWVYEINQCGHAKYVTESRPWWHLCCNGDPGGWRTSLCDYFEHSWRYCRYQRSRDAAES